jgi:hypothetical protein
MKHTIKILYLFYLISNKVNYNDICKIENLNQKTLIIDREQKLKEKKIFKIICYNYIIRL